MNRKSLRASALPGCRHHLLLLLLLLAFPLHKGKVACQMQARSGRARAHSRRARAQHERARGAKKGQRRRRSYMGMRW